MATAVLLMVSGLSIVSTKYAIANTNITNTALTGLIAPVTGATPVTSLSDPQFTATVAWFPDNPTTFDGGTRYSATVTITPAGGFQFPQTFGTCTATFTAVGSNGYNCVSRSPYSTGTLIINYPVTSGSSSLPAAVITSTSTINVGQANPSIVIQTSTGAFDGEWGTSAYVVSVGTTGLTAGNNPTVTGGNLTVPFTGTASAGTVTFTMRLRTLGQFNVSNTLSFVVGGGSTPAPSTPEQIAAAAAAQAAAVAAAARAAEAVAAAIRAAEIATAQTSLATVLRGDKAGTLSEYRAANINITTTAALTRLNAEVLKLSAADRADFAKIKAIAEKIEFDESFFNATARPSIATYSSYGVTGVTERILPVINAKVLELPAALRADVKAMQELVKVESFVDRIANPVTRTTVSAAVLVSRGLLTAENPRRHSIVNGLSRYPEGSLNTMAKIEAAIKEQIFIAEAPKRRLAEIKARMAARKK